MKRLCQIFLIGLFVWAVKARAEDTMPLRMVQTIPLPNVEGRIDHMAVDVKGQQLFIAALGNNTVEVVDLQAASVPRASADSASRKVSVSFPN